MCYARLTGCRRRAVEGALDCMVQELFSAVSLRRDVEVIDGQVGLRCRDVID